MLSYGYDDDSFFEVMLRGVFKLKNYYGNTGQSQYEDSPESKIGENYRNQEVESQITRPVTAHTNINKQQRDAPFATDDKFNMARAEQERPKSSISYSQRNSELSVSKDQFNSKYNPITGA